MTKSFLFGSVAAVALLLSSPARAGCPEFPKHANMHKAAADLCAAHAAVVAAVEANQADLGGHAAESLKHMQQAMVELEKAAKFANEKHEKNEKKK